jgi:hypothetical protein
MSNPTTEQKLAALGLTPCDSFGRHQSQVAALADHDATGEP